MRLLHVSLERDEIYENRRGLNDGIIAVALAGRGVYILARGNLGRPPCACMIGSKAWA
jgi:hypothetical protein